tara:strand:- start:60 stop:974 length:915 start_codon:yes stop_codon:yes gene_type:complete
MKKFNDLFVNMLLIRRAEEKLLEMFSKGMLNGTTHTSIGQEACAVGVISALDLEKDIVFSNHRCHGHFLAYRGPLDLLFGEVMGKEVGTCSGIGGSQHLQYKNFYSNGVQGGIVPTSTGMAFAEKLKKTSAITVVFLGDGTMGEGVIYESFNLASLWGIPILYVIEANGYAQTTSTGNAQVGNFIDRVRSFEIGCKELNVDSPVKVKKEAKQMVDRIRSSLRPGCLILNTYRLGPHSKGDDFRKKEEIEKASSVDPLNQWLKANSGKALQIEEKRIRSMINASVERVSSSDSLSVEKFISRVNK